MKALLQRVSSASVSINNSEHSSIPRGLLILLGIAGNDTEEDATWLAKKIIALRIFNDAAGLMNLDVQQANGSLMVVSQFTLHASYKKGNRPSFLNAAKPEFAEPLYRFFVEQSSKLSGKEIKTGIFGADMQVALVNDGPVTLLLDTHNKE